MSKRYTTLLCTVLALFALLYLLLCYYSRLATDDYYFIWDVREHGLVKGVTSQYMEWCGRYAATFFMDVMYRFGGLEQSRYTIFPVLSMVLLVAGMWLLLRVIASQLGFALTRMQEAMLAFSFTALLFFLSVDIGETWFWYCSLSSYLWSVIAFVWGAAFLFGKNNLINTLLAALCFIYAGGSSEVYSVIYGILFLVFLIYRYRQTKNFKLFFNDGSNRRILFIYALFGIAFLVFLIAPGNYLRDELFPEHPFFYSFFISAKSIVKFIALYLPFKLPYLLTFAMPFLFIGNAVATKTNRTIPFRKILRIATALFVALLLFFFYMVAFVMVETGPPRVWFILSFLLSAYASLLCFCAGYAICISVKRIMMLQYISVCIGMLLLVYHLYTQSTIAHTYAQAQDARIAQLRVLKQQIRHDTIITLQALPPAGMLYSAEIQPDTAHFTNKELRLGEALPFHVIAASHTAQ